MIARRPSRPWAQRLALLGAIGAFALLGTATVPAAPPRAPRPDAGPPAARSPGAVALAALEAQLGRGAVGDGPGALAIARDLQTECDPGACSVVVKVVPTTPRRVAVLIQTNTLREMPDLQRRATLREIRVILDEEHMTSDAEIAVGLKGRVFYGAVGFRTRLTPWRMDTGTVVSVAPIEALLAAPTLAVRLPPTPVLHVAAPVTGRFAPGEIAPQAFHVSVAAPGRYRLHAHLEEPTTDYVRVELCRGHVTPRDCTWRLQVREVDDPGRDPVYELPAGPYTVVVKLSQCDLAANPRCTLEQQGTYTLMLVPSG